MFWYGNESTKPPPINPMKDKITEDLLKCEEHFDVTIKCEDGEIKSSKFFLSARSEYFSTMFKEDHFLESSGIVKFECKKIVMEKIVHFLYGKELKFDELSLEERLELYNLMKMMMIEKIVDNLEENLFFPLVKTKAYNSYDAVVPTAAKVLDATLKLNLDVSRKIANYMGDWLNDIVWRADDDSDDFSLSRPVIVALANSTAREMDKMKLYDHLKKTDFPVDEIPKLELRRFSIEELEGEIMTSGLFEETAVLKEIIQKQKQTLGMLSNK